jgi:hypothetical protein
LYDCELRVFQDKLDDFLGILYFVEIAHPGTDGLDLLRESWGCPEGEEQVLD